MQPKRVIAKRKAPAKPKATTKNMRKDEEYEVERVLDHRSKRDGRIFLIRWKGYNSDEDTWESEDGLKCPLLLKRYFAGIEKDKRKHTLAQNE